MDNNIKDNEQEIVKLRNQLKEANEKLENFQEAINSLDTNIYWKNINGVYLGCNISVAKLAGKKNINEIIGLTDYDLSDNGIAKQLIEHDKLVFETKLDKNLQEEYVLPSGEKRDYVVKKSPLIDNNGNVKGIIGVSIDITERKNMEKKIKQQYDELQQKDALKKQFIENFSHDIKVPINALVGRTQLLKMIGQKEKNKMLVEASEGAENSAMILDTLFTQMQDIIVHEQFDENIYNTNFNLFDLVNKEVEIAESSISPHKRINIHYEVSEDLKINISSDYYKLSQIMRNLLSNAVKFTDDGNINICAEIKEKDLDQVEFKFMVIDTGIGIDKSYQKSIFEQFNRAGITSHENNRHGMGIGLYIAKNNVEILSGKIDFESSPGQGSRFWFEVPLTLR